MPTEFANLQHYLLNNHNGVHISNVELSFLSGMSQERDITGTTTGSWLRSTDITMLDIDRNW